MNIDELIINKALENHETWFKYLRNKTNLTEHQLMILTKIHSAIEDILLDYHKM